MNGTIVNRGLGLSRNGGKSLWCLLYGNSLHPRLRWLTTLPLSVPPRRGDWTHQELCEIDRIRAECAPHSNFELQCSHTDEGDPWCIVYDREWDVSSYTSLGLTAGT